MQASSFLDNLLPFKKNRDLPLNDKASQSKGLTPNILAFRTITTLLARLPRNTPIPAVDNLRQDDKNDISSSDRFELKMLDAFAHVVAGDHDIAALVTNRGFDDSGELRILSCIDYLPVDQNVPNRQLSWLEAINIRKEWMLGYLRNPRKEDPDTGAEIPTIASAEAPNDMGGLDAHSYVQKLLGCWKTPTLPNHLWILSKILSPRPGLKSGSSDLPVISSYVAAMSYTRMHRRFTNKSLSQPFIESLRNVKSSEIPPWSTSPHAHANIKLKTEERSQDVGSDLVFLETVVLFFAKNQMIRTDITNLIEIAREVSTTDKVVLMYTDKTRVEFHNLLIELLDRFGDALDELVKIDGRKETALNADEARLFEKHLHELYRYGYALLKLSRGRAFQMHLNNIGSYLQDHRAAIAGISADESDEDPQALIGKTMLQSYTAWLQLLVGQFDAVEILLHFVYSEKCPYKTISIEILSVQKTDTNSLQWQKLFTDNIIPPSTNIESPSNDDLLKFLRKHRKAYLDWKADLARVEKALEASQEYQSISSKVFIGLKDHADVIVAQKAGAVLACIDEYNGEPHKFSEKSGAAISALHARMEEIASRTRHTDDFFRDLDKMSAGNLHCETCLASLLPNFTNTTELLFKTSKGEDINMLMSKMQHFGRVIGISKRCCPACASFLNALVKVPTQSAAPEPKPFIVRGSHGTIFPCTLPPWTPDAVAKAMVNTYASRLREDLVAFKNMVENNARSNNRCRATGSERLSVDSVQSVLRADLEDDWHFEGGQ